jgi:hypothetical protein
MASCPGPSVAPVPAEPDPRYGAFRYAVAGLYGALSLWLVVLFVRLRRRAPERRWPAVFYGCAAAGSVGRAVFFALQPAIAAGDVAVPNCVNSLLSVIPSLFFFSAYLVLVFFW